MDIDSAIGTLKEFKKMTKKIGECDIVGFNDNSFTFKVKFGDDAPERVHVTGFNITRRDKHD